MTFLMVSYPMMPLLNFIVCRHCLCLSTTRDCSRDLCSDTIDMKVVSTKFGFALVVILVFLWQMTSETMLFTMCLRHHWSGWLIALPLSVLPVIQRHRLSYCGIYCEIMSLLSFVVSDVLRFSDKASSMHHKVPSAMTAFTRIRFLIHLFGSLRFTCRASIMLEARSSQTKGRSANFHLWWSCDW